MNFIYFILVFVVASFIHELGNFIFAKRAGIYVYEFSIGIGPKLFQIHSKKDETVYCIRLFPIGGYVQTASESTEQNISKEEMLQSNPWFQRFRNILASVLFNVLLTIFLCFLFDLINLI